MKILWDLDGTIVNTIPSLVETFMTLAKELSIKVDRDIVEKYTRISSKELFRYYGIDWVKNEKRFREINKNFKVNELELFLGVKEVLAENKNYLVTNRFRKSAIEILEYWNILDFFDEIVCGDDGFPRKPDETSYHYIHTKYKIDLVIGDRDLDLIPARKLGIKTCLYDNTLDKANYYLDSYLDFPKVFKTKN